jgi:hypothetical protein
MRLIADLADVAVPETQPRMEGNQMHTILAAKKGAKPTPKPTGPAAPRQTEVETK